MASDINRERLSYYKNKWLHLRSWPLQASSIRKGKNIPTKREKTMADTDDHIAAKKSHDDLRQPRAPAKPNPDKPVVAKRKSRFIGELNIDDWRLKICCIALRGVGATTPTSRRLKYSIWLWRKSCANMLWFQWIGTKLSPRLRSEKVAP